MASYYDALNDFYKQIEQEPLAGSAQLVYLHLLHMNNRLGNRGLVQVSDRMLEYTTRLSKSSVTAAKRTLKNRGLIDFKTIRGKPTKIEIIFFGEVQQVGHHAGELTGHPAGQSSVDAVKNAREDKKKKKEEKSVSQSARADELIEYWVEIGGGRLSPEHISKLREYVESRGIDWVRTAMKEASDANHDRYGVKPKLLMGVLAAKSEVKVTKRGEEYDQPPEYDFLD